MMEKNGPLPSSSENNGVFENRKSDRSHYKKFDKQFKIAIVKRIKENRLPVAQVAEEEGIHSSAIHHWISEYETRGENAFRGRGRVSPNMKKVIDRLFQDVADDKERMLESRAYRQRSFDKNFILSTVKRIKENQLPVMQVSEKLGIDVTTINRWIRTYEDRGEDGFPGRNTPNRKKYDRQLKMVAVKLVKEDSRPISEVEKNLGIGSGNLQQWLLQYEKYGENSFQGSGSVSPHPDKRGLIKELFKNEIAAAAAVSDTTPTIDADKYGALNLTPEKEKELAACSYKLKRYDKDFKISIVKRIKENQLPLPQVSEILGIDDSLLSEWVREYDEKGENNAFPGGGYKSHNFQRIDAPAQNKSAEAAVLDTNSDTNSVKNTAANKKKVASGSNKKPVYDRNFKLAAVKLVNENKLSPPQVAKEINISYDRLGKWLREYEIHGENAFPGSGVYHDPNS